MIPALRQTGANIGRYLGRRWLVEYAYILPVAAYPVMFVYFHNCTEAAAAQIWLPLTVFMGVAAGLFAVFSFVARRLDVGVLTAQVAMLVIALWRPLETAVRDVLWRVRYWHLLPLAVAVCWGLALALGRWMQHDSRRDLRLRKWLAFIFTGLIVYNAAVALPLLLHPTQHRHSLAAGAPVAVRSPAEQPDVYYIILDEYASFAQMSEYFGKYPTNFAAFLEQHAFNVSTGSYNPAFLTTEVMAGLVGMTLPERSTRYELAPDGRLQRYVDCPAGYQDVFAESALMRFFKDRGYAIYVSTMLGNLFNLRTPFLTDHVFQLNSGRGEASLQNTVFATVMEGSALAPLLACLPQDPHYYNRLVEDLFTWLADPAGKVHPRFMFVHVACPHAPYLFEKDGTWRMEPGSLSDSANYLEQYLFVTARIMTVLEKLLAADPDCVVILQSDHGYRHEITLPVDDMTHIFNAVYFRGRRLKVEGLSGLDTERRVLNELFGTDFFVFAGRRPLAGVPP